MPAKNRFCAQPLMPAPSEIVRLGDEGDPPIHGQRCEQPVCEREVIAGNDRRALVRDVLRALMDRAEDLGDHGPEQYILQRPVDRPASTGTRLDRDGSPSIDRYQILADGVLRARASGGRVAVGR